MGTVVPVQVVTHSAGAGGVFLVADRGPEVPSLGGQDKRVLRLCARVAHATDVGRKRHNNQDNHLILLLGGSAISPKGGAILIGDEDSRLLVAVADGMGGHFGGDMASRLCMENLAKEIVNQFSPSENGQPDLATALQKAVEGAHKSLFAHAQAYVGNLTMGTTLTAALLHGACAELAQVGDSRAYLFRRGNLILLTQDQTIGSQLRSRGEDPINVDAQIQEMLVQAVGAQPEIEVMMTATDLEPKDSLLLCSDGLYKVVSPAEIVGTLELEMGLQEKATRLVTRANEGGGPDNITVILTEISKVESPS